MNRRCSRCEVSLGARGDIDGDYVCDTCDGKGKKKKKKVLKRVIKKRSYSALYRSGFLILFTSGLLGTAAFFGMIFGITQNAENELNKFIRLFFFTGGAGMFLIALDSQRTGVAGHSFDRINRILAHRVEETEKAIFEVEKEDKKVQFYIANGAEFMFSFFLLIMGTAL